MPSQTQLLHPGKPFWNAALFSECEMKFIEFGLAF